LVLDRPPGSAAPKLSDCHQSRGYGGGWAVSVHMSSTARLLENPTVSVDSDFFADPFSLLFWFFSAPSPRFAQATIWILAIDLFYLGAIAAAKLTEAAGKLAILVSTTFMAVEIIFGLARLNAEPIQFPNYIGAAPPMVLQLTKSGAAIWVPAQGTDSVDWKLPVTPIDRFDSNLEFRGTTLREGFRIREALLLGTE